MSEESPSLEAPEPGPSTETRPDRGEGPRMVLLAYAVAFLVAVLCAAWLGTLHPLSRTLGADVAATVCIFAFSVAFRNSSFYDAYWSVVPPLIALYWGFAFAAPEVPALRQILVFALVSAWGARLTANWYRGWTGLDHEDWRYRDLQEKTGGAYWLVSFSGIHLFPTLAVFAGCLSLWPAMAAGTRPFGWLDGLALLVTGGAIALEAVADEQLRGFRRSRPAPGTTFTGGLWGRSRHPNYLGEIGFWWGLWLFGVAADPGAFWWTLLGPAIIHGMFLVVSLPMIETRMLDRRKDYAEVQQRIPMLWPRLWPGG